MSKVNLKYPATSYKLLSTPKLFLEDLEKEIGNAKSSIDLQFYTFEADKIGYRTADSLFRAKLRGLKVRLIIDHFINLFHNDYMIMRPRFNRKLHRSIIDEWKNTRKLIILMKSWGIEIKWTNPLGFLLHKAFQRNHKKIVIIDGNNPKRAIAYIGGCNISEHNAAWNDFMVKMKGDMIPVLLNDFNATWKNRDIDGKIRYSDGYVLIDSPKNSNEIVPFLIDSIAKASKRIVIESPYIRGKNIWENLIEARTRGVDISIIVPFKNNRKSLGPTNESLSKLIEYGIKVYKFTKNEGMTHAKAVLIDDMTMFGSSNMSEFWSRRLCEISIATDNPSMVTQMAKKLQSDINMSSPQKV